MKIQPVTLKGHYEITHRDKDGKVKEVFAIDNTITTTGKVAIANLLRGAATSSYKYLSLDASSTAAAAANTTLASEITSPSLKRVVATTSQATTNVSNDTSQCVHTFSSTATQSVYGVGLFDTPTSGGTMASRATFSVKNLVSGDTLQVTHKLVVA